MQKIYIKTLHGCQAANLKVIYASISLMATQKNLFLSQPGILLRRESSTARDPQPPEFVHLRSSFTGGDPLYRRGTLTTRTLPPPPPGGFLHCRVFSTAGDPQPLEILNRRWFRYRRGSSTAVYLPILCFLKCCKSGSASLCRMWI